MDLFSPDKSELGKKTLYESTYNPDKLFPIPRAVKREEIGIKATLPFSGFDYWMHYEVSWLNPKGKPIVAIAHLVFNCEASLLIESKSMKLYFNSLNSTKFKDTQEVIARVQQDLQARVKTDVSVDILPLDSLLDTQLCSSLEGECIDHLDVECNQYVTDPTLLRFDHELVDETIHSHLLKSNCLVTGQPDWGSIQISYRGNKIQHESLLRYIVSFREHTEFGEHCVERIFMDIMRYCQPIELTVLGQYTRRGGIDIMSIRSTQALDKNVPIRRLYRQ